MQQGSLLHATDVVRKTPMIFSNLFKHILEVDNI